MVQYLTEDYILQLEIVVGQIRQFGLERGMEMPWQKEFARAFLFFQTLVIRKLSLKNKILYNQ